MINNVRLRLFIASSAEKVIFVSVLQIKVILFYNKYLFYRSPKFIWNTTR